jgi:hypothetical protein
MKKLIVLLFSPLLFTACNNNGTATADTKDSSKMDASSSKMDASSADNGNVELVYTMKYVSDWVPGDPHHAAMVMKALKGFETGNINDTKQYFADSVTFIGDGYKFKGTRDSLMSVFNNQRAGYKDFVVTMHDWESVKSKSRGEEYVTMWYMQKTTDMKGRKDSANYTDDVRIVNGKIAQIDSKVQHFPKGKM